MPPRFQDKTNVRFRIHAVYQKTLPDGKKCWIKDRDKNFLPDGYQRDTIPVNPITIPLNQMVRTEDGNLEYANGDKF